MKNITALIVDDERSARSELRRMLASYPMVSIIGEAANADEAEELVHALQPDLLLLDIQMPGRSGFELLENLTFVPIVIFITAFDNYALQAFEVSALDYLMKPMREERFAKAMAAVTTRLANQEQGAIFVKDKGRYHFIKWQDVQLIESLDNYARLHVDNTQVLVKTSLNQLEARLNSQTFFRANRAQIINVTHVISMGEENGQYKVTLNNGHTVLLSTRQNIKFKQMHR